MDLGCSRSDGVHIDNWIIGDASDFEIGRKGDVIPHIWIFSTTTGGGRTFER